MSDLQFDVFNLNIRPSAALLRLAHAQDPLTLLKVLIRVVDGHDLLRLMRHLKVPLAGYLVIVAVRVLHDLARLLLAPAVLAQLLAQELPLEVLKRARTNKQ